MNTVAENINKEEVLEEILEELENQETEESTESKASAEDGDNMAPEEEGTAEQAEEAEPEAKEAGDKESKKIFGKKKSKEDKKVEALNEKITELEDKVRRQMAEFDNFRKRTEKEKAAMFETGAKSVIDKILPVVDNFERGLATLSEEEKGTPFAEGMQMTYKQLMTEMESIGIKPIEALGAEFDPNLHNAVMQVDTADFESGVVAQELMKGYTYRDTVVRHSMVGVAQ